MSELGSALEELTRLGDRLRDVADPTGLLVNLFAQAPVPLQVYRADGRCVLVNGAYRALFGKEPPREYNVFADEVAKRKGITDFVRRGFLGMTVQVPAVWWDPPEIARTDIAAGQRIAIESVVLPLLDADGVARHVAVVFKDVTAEMQLTAEHSRLTTLMGHSVDVTYLQAADGSVLYVSPAVERVLGYTAEEVARLTPWELFHPADVPHARGLYEAAFQRPGETLSAEYRVHHKDGSWRWIAIAATNLLFDPDVRAVATHFRDVTAHRRIEDAIRASEAQLAVTLDSIADSVIATDNDGRVTRMNPAAELLTGWPLAEARGLPLQEVFAIFNEQTRQPVQSPVELVLRDGAVVGLANHTLLRARDGTEHPVADSAAPIRDPSGQVRGVVLVFRDQTEQRKALEALSASETRFRAMSDCSPLGIFVTDAQFNTTYVNPSMCAIVGLSPDEMLGQGWTETIHPKDRDRVLAEVKACNDTGTSLRTVIRHVHKDGTVVHADVQSAPMLDGDKLLGIIGTAQDITDRVAARDAIERARRDLYQLINRSPEGIAVAHDGRWVYVNQTLARILGYASADELRGRHVSGLVHPDDWPTVEANVARAHAGADLTPTETRYIRADGEQVVLERSFARLDEFEGAPGHVLTFRDVTERKKLQAQLLMSERMVSIGTLAAGMAHEINNPLAAGLGNLEWMSTALAQLAEECRKGEFGGFSAVLGSRFNAINEAMRDTRDACDRIRLIVRDVKVFSRAEEELHGPVSLTRVLDSAARLAHNELRHRARFFRNYGDLPLAFGNEARLAQVFLNLFMNAAQAIPEGQAEKNEIRVSAHVDPDGRIAVEVKDTGCGMPPKVLARIFDPFFTTKPIGVGVGLGLTICHRIVTDFGGTIEGESEPGKGTVMRVRLSQVTGAIDSTPATPLPVVSPRRGRILLIDDDPAVAATMSRVIEEHHDVEIVTRARSALDLVRSGKWYDVVFCDLMMPEMTGIDFYEEIVSHYPDVTSRIIFITGGAFTVRAREFLDRVPNQRVEKPFDARVLLALIDKRLR